MDKSKFAELLARAKAAQLAAKEEREAEAATELQKQLATTDSVDTTLLGITDESIKTDAGQDQAVEIIRDVIDSIVADPTSASVHAGTDDASAVESGEASTESAGKIAGVARDVVLNAAQQEAHNLVVLGTADLVLIGAAGTGKTTSMRKTTRSLIDTGKVKPLQQSTKWLQSGLPGAVIVSFTRKAVNNIRHAVADELKPHTQTLHKFLEFAPIFYEIEDESKPGEFKKTMRFEPQRNASNPLPPDLRFVGIEESSMVSVDLHEMWKAAMPHEHQTIYIGDIQQLPPVFGLAILGFKMLDTKIVELTEVYRQALNSPIIRLAWGILGGNPFDFSSKTESYETISGLTKKPVTRIKVPALEKYNEESEHGTVKIQIWQKQLSPDNGLNTFVKQATTWSDTGYYNPQEDIILCPFNKAFGTIEINKGIMQHLAVKREAVVHEIIAGYEKHYLAIGDRVLYDKEDAFITGVARNDEYLGKRPMAASKNLDRWGHYREELKEEEKLQAQIEDEEMDMEAMEKFMASAIDDAADRVQAASHVISIRLAIDDGDSSEIELTSAGEINNLLGGYAITVHKAQGSEWERVFLCLSNAHAVMCSRELLYTAVTRARSFLHIICEPFTFEKGIKSQRIKGNTLAEKAEFFKGKESEYDKKKAAKPTEDVAFKSGVYKGVQTPIHVAVEKALKKVELWQFERFVPQDIKDAAIAALDKVWAQAAGIWGKEKLGPVPTISYALRKTKTLGTANYLKREIKLNPLWCILAAGDNRIRTEMLVHTLKHEVAHIIEGVYAKEAGHGSGWRMTMMLLGLAPEVYYTGDSLPEWTVGYKQAVDKIKRDIFDADEIEDGEYDAGEVE